MKLHSNALIAAVAALSAGSASGNEDVIENDSRSLGRGLAGLAQRWNISEPSFGYVNKTFSLNWEISDYIQDKFMFFRIYDGENCQTGVEEGTANDITPYMGDLSSGNAFLVPRFTVDSNTGYQPNEAISGNGIRQAFLHMEIQPEYISNSSIYRENDAIGNVNAEIRFCTRFSLWNDYALAYEGRGFNGTATDNSTATYNEDAVEVNFQETIITLNIDLSDGFEIGSVAVEPADRTLRTANLACEVVGYECDEQNEPLDVPGFVRNQGSLTRVCVTTTEQSKLAGLYMNRVNWFYFYRDNGADGIVQQNAIIPDSVRSPNGLTDYDCKPGEDPCGWDTILFANFFDRPGVGIVEGVGEATCQFGQTIDPNASPADSPPGADDSTPDGPDSTPQDPAPTPQDPNSPDPSPETNPESAPTESAPAPQTAPQPAPTPAPQNTLSPAAGPVQPVANSPVAPTAPAPVPAPDSFQTLELTCGTEPIVTYDSSEGATTTPEPIPEGAIVITGQDGTSVNFTVTQLWATDHSSPVGPRPGVNWIAVYLPEYSDGMNQCHKSSGYMDGAAFGGTKEYQANCFDDGVNPIHIFIEVLIQDNQQGYTTDNGFDIVQIPDSCDGQFSTANEDKNRLGYQVYIPCAPCEGERRIMKENSGELLESSHVVSQPRFEKKGNSFSHSDRVAQNMAQRRRAQEEEYDGPPVPFEMEFTIVQVSEDGYSGAMSLSASIIVTGVLAWIGVLAVF